MNKELKAFMEFAPLVKNSFKATVIDKSVRNTLDKTGSPVTYYSVTLADEKLTKAKSFNVDEATYNKVEIDQVVEPLFFPVEYMKDGSKQVFYRTILK